MGGFGLALRRIRCWIPSIVTASVAEGKRKGVAVPLFCLGSLRSKPDTKIQGQEAPAGARQYAGRQLIKDARASQAPLWGTVMG